MSLRKRMKLETTATVETVNQSNENQVDQGISVDGAAVSTESHNQPENPPTPPPYLKLIADCWEHIFDYLSIRDVLVMGQTCKRMEQMAGYYVREYFPELRFDLIKRKVELRYPYSFHLKPDFCRYITKLCILENSRLDFYLDDKMFPALKTLIFKWFKFDETRLEFMRNVLKNVENIHMENCLLRFGSFDQFAALCPKLKYLRISCCDIPENSLKSLFSQHFPLLERLQYKTRRWNFDVHMRIDELKTFLEVHTKLKHFECSVPVLWANRGLLRDTNVQLDLFAIDFYAWSDRIPFDRLADFLNELHERGVYKTLHLLFDYDSDIGFEHLDNALAKLPAIEILSIEDESIINLSRLTSLKELHICYGYEYENDVEFVSTSLMRLERLVFKCASIDDILPFIRNSKRLKSIEIYKVVDAGEDVNVFALNEERKKCTSGSPILLHLPEPTYLRAKWKTENLNLSHVKIARILQDNF